MRVSNRSLKVIGAWVVAVLLAASAFAAGTPGVGAVARRCSQETLDCEKAFAEIPKLRSECGYCFIGVMLVTTYTYDGAMLISVVSAIPCLLFTLRRDRAARIALRLAVVLVLAVVLAIAYLQYGYLTL